MKANNQLKINSKQQIFSGVDIASIWAGINICLPSFMLGGLLVPGLSFKQALFATVIGNIILTVLIYLMAFPGLKHGYASAYFNRYVFGYPAGVIIPSAVVIISMIGWSAILLEMSAQAAYEISSLYSDILSLNHIIIVVGLLILFSSYAGPESIKFVNKINLPVLIILLIWITYILFEQNSINELINYHPSGEFNLSTALDLVVGGTIAGAFVSSDLNRYARNKKALASGVFIGTIPITILLAIMGIFSRLGTGSWNPVDIIINLGLGIPALFLVIISTWTTIQASLYSASLAFNSLFPALSRKKATSLLGISLIILACFKIMEYLEGWLLFLDNLFVPMITISLIKFFWQKEIPSPEYLNWPVVISLAVSITLNQILALPFPTFLSAMVWTTLVYLLLQIKLFNNFLSKPH